MKKKPGSGNFDKKGRREEPAPVDPFESAEAVESEESLVRITLPEESEDTDDTGESEDALGAIDADETTEYLEELQASEVSEVHEETVPLQDQEEDDNPGVESENSVQAVMWLTIFMILVASIWTLTWKMMPKSISGNGAVKQMASNQEGGAANQENPLPGVSSESQMPAFQPPQAIDDQALTEKGISPPAVAHSDAPSQGATVEAPLEPVCDPASMYGSYDGASQTPCSAGEIEACFDISRQIEYVVDFLLESLPAGEVTSVTTAGAEERTFENLKWKWVRKEVLAGNPARVCERLTSFFRGSSFQLLGTTEEPSEAASGSSFVMAAGYMGRAMIEIAIMPSAGAGVREKRVTSVPVGDGQIRAAIIIDDLGYGGQATKELMELPPVITFSILPWEKFSVATAELARSRGFEVMLHQPMEGSSPRIRLGPGGLFTNMKDSDIRKKFRENLAHLGRVSGVNNHMGSVYTADDRCMKVVLQEAAKHGLYFVDSRTTVKTVAEERARLMGVPCARRRVFLDNEVEDEPIRKQLRQLMVIARKEGFAIGIGHAHLQTVRSIAAMLPEFEKEGIMIVPAGELVK